jgi:hypothetical protein
VTCIQTLLERAYQRQFLFLGSVCALPPLLRRERERSPVIASTYLAPVCNGSGRVVHSLLLGWKRVFLHRLGSVLLPELDALSDEAFYCFYLCAAVHCMHSSVLHPTNKACYIMFTMRVFFNRTLCGNVEWIELYMKKRHGHVVMKSPREVSYAPRAFCNMTQAPVDLLESLENLLRF